VSAVKYELCISQKATFFTVTAVKTSNVTYYRRCLTHFRHFLQLKVHCSVYKGPSPTQTLSETEHVLASRAMRTQALRHTATVSRGAAVVSLAY
jgi:hypothetical protein